MPLVVGSRLFAARKFVLLTLVGAGVAAVGCGEALTLDETSPDPDPGDDAGLGDRRADSEGEDGAPPAGDAGPDGTGGADCIEYLERCDETLPCCQPIMGPTIVCRGARCQECFVNGEECENKQECCDPAALCSPGGKCCVPSDAPCNGDQDCCSKTCKAGRCE